MGNVQARVGIEAGDGLVARFGDALLFIGDPGQYVEGTGHLLETVEAAASAAGTPGAVIAARLATIITTSAPEVVPPFGVVAPLGDAYLVLLHGAVSAQISSPEGVERLSGRKAVTWVDHRHEGPVDSLSVGSEDHTVGVGPWSDLKAGTVPGNGFIMTPATSGGAIPEGRPVLVREEITEEPAITEVEAEAIHEATVWGTESPAAEGELVDEVPAAPEPGPAEGHDPETPVTEAPVTDAEAQAQPTEEQQEAHAAEAEVVTEVAPAEPAPLEPDGPPEEAQPEEAQPDEQPAVVEWQAEAEPAAEAPAAEAPAAEAPAAEAPVAVEPVVEPAVLEPATAQLAPVELQPVTAQPSPVFGAGVSPETLDVQPVVESQAVVYAQAQQAVRATEMVTAPIGFLVATTDGMRIPLDRAYVLGREPGNDASVQSGSSTPIQLNEQDSLISRVQSYIVVDNGQVWLKDASSANGTYYAAPGAPEWTRLGTDPVVLPPTWSLRVGDSVFTYVPAAAIA